MYHLFLLEPDGEWTFLRSCPSVKTAQWVVGIYERCGLIVEWLGW